MRAGSSRLRPSTNTEPRMTCSIAACNRCAGTRTQSVMSTTASARHAASTACAAPRRPRDRPAARVQSDREPPTVAPARTSCRGRSSTAGASRTSSVSGLNASPRRHTRRPRQHLHPRPELVEHEAAPPVVHLLHREQQRWRLAVVVRGAHQLRQVLAEAGATPADAGGEERPADASVEPDGVGDVGDVRTHELADGGDLVDVADLHGQERVGRVLHRLAVDQAGGDERGSASERPPGKLCSSTGRVDRAGRARVATGSSLPSTTRSGCRKSLMAEPSRRNSGHDTTESSSSTGRSPV